MCPFDWNLFLEFTKVIISWPLVTLVIFIVVLSTFKTPISEWIKDIGDVEGDLWGNKIKVTAQRQAKIQNVTEIIEDTAKIAEATLQTTDLNNIEIPEELKHIPNIEKLIALAATNPANTVLELNRLMDKYIFERIFNIIFGTQINLLSFLNSSPDEWHDVSNISGFYAKHRELLKDSVVDHFDYLNFLRSSGLAELIWGDETKKIKATKQTGEFLKYIQAFYAANWNMRNF